MDTQRYRHNNRELKDHLTVGLTTRSRAITKATLERRNTGLTQAPRKLGSHISADLRYERTATFFQRSNTPSAYRSHLRSVRQPPGGHKIRREKRSRAPRRRSVSRGNDVAAFLRRRVNLRGACRQQCFCQKHFNFQARLDRVTLVRVRDSEAASRGTFQAALVALRQGLRCASENLWFVRAG